MTRDEYAALLKDAALTTGKRLVIEAIGKAVPFLGTSFFSPIVGWIVGKVLTIAIEQTEFGLFFLYIDLRTSSQGRDFEKAAQANQAAQKGTPDEKQKAEAHLIDALRRFARYDS